MFWRQVFAGAMPWCMTCHTMSYQWIPWDRNCSERKWHHVRLPASQQYQATGVKVSSIEWSSFKFHGGILKLAHFSVTPKPCSWDSFCVADMVLNPAATALVYIYLQSLGLLMWCQQIIFWHCKWNFCGLMSGKCTRYGTIHIKEISHWTPH